MLPQKNTIVHTARYNDNAIKNNVLGTTSRAISWMIETLTANQNPSNFKGMTLKHECYFWEAFLIVTYCVDAHIVIVTADVSYSYCWQCGRPLTEKKRKGQSKGRSKWTQAICKRGGVKVKGRVKKRKKKREWESKIERRVEWVKHLSGLREWWPWQSRQSVGAGRIEAAGERVCLGKSVACCRWNVTGTSARGHAKIVTIRSQQALGDTASVTCLTGSGFSLGRGRGGQGRERESFLDWDPAIITLRRPLFMPPLLVYTDKNGGDWLMPHCVLSYSSPASRHT